MTASAPPRRPRAAPTSAVSVHVHVQLLGSPQWATPGRAPVALAPKDAALLALLALDGPQSRQTVCALLWPEKPPLQAATNLRQRLSRLHRDAGAKVVHSDDVLCLGPQVGVDALNLATLPAAALLQCAQLLAGLEFGEEDELDRWLAAARTRLAEAQAQALASHAEDLMRAGALRDALPLAARVVELTPLAEHGWRRLMRVHYLRADRGAALAAFERLAALLLDELGVQPSAETLQLWQTIESAVLRTPLPQQPVPASVMLPPVMVGRDRAWHALSQAWQQARPFVLVGEAGLGKSRLLQEFLSGRDDVLFEKARPGDAQVPYAVLGRVLLALQQRYAVLAAEAVQREVARIQPALGPAWPSPARPEVLRHAVLEFLRAALDAGLQVLVLDDLHDADLATLETLRWLAQCPPLQGLKLGLALRPPQTAPLDALLQAWLADSQPPVWVPLGPLSPADLAALLASLALPELVDPAVTAHLFRHAGGHPLYTLATLQDALAHGQDLRRLKLPHPPSVQALLDTRLRELPASAQPLLQVAAVAGPDLNAERAAAVLGCTALDLSPAWRVLEAANVLRGEQFTHDLVHEAALRAVPLGLRVALHRQWAALLAGDARAHVGRVAWHWESGERWDEAGRCWHAAGQAARQAGRLAEQAELFERAACCFQQSGDDALRFDALTSRLDGLQLHQGGAAVLAALPAVEALADTSLRRLRCHLARAEALLDGEHAQDALVQAQRAVDEAALHPEWRADAGALLALALAQCRLWDAALTAARTALLHAQGQAQVHVQQEPPQKARRRAPGRAPASNPPKPVAAPPGTAQQLRATHALAYVLYSRGQLAEAVPVQRDAMVLAERLGDRAEAAAAEGHLAALYASVGDVPATYRHAVHAHQRHRAAGLGDNSTLGIVNHFVQGAAAAYLGRFDEALQTLQSAAALAENHAVVAVQAKARLALAHLWLTLGQPEAARRLVSALPTGMVPAMQVQAALVMAQAAAQDGAPHRRHWQTLAQLAAAHPHLPLVQSAWFELSHQGDAAAMVKTLARVRAECEGLGLHGTARTLQLRELARLLDLGGSAASARVLDLALPLLPHADAGMSAKVYPPQAWLTLAQAFERAGQAAQRQACLAQGRQWLARAAPTVPACYRPGFEAVNATNRALLQPPAPG